MIGIIGGTGLYNSTLMNRYAEENIETEYGLVKLFLGEQTAFLPRHGIDADIPPHRINFKANISAFKQKGIKEIIGVNSVGSLNENIPPPTILIPHDYMNPFRIPTYFDSKIVHITPSLSKSLRERIIQLAKAEKMNFIDRGIYIQTLGPRLETKAEIKMLKSYGEVVGMTMASEATLAKELELEYASICSVDNFANGIVKEELSFTNIKKNAGVNCEIILDFLMKFVKEEP
jgi:5'-methylthioadenosine phosphorylase